MNLVRQGGQQGGARVQPDRDRVDRPAVEVGGDPSRLAEDEERSREIERSHRGGRYLQGDPAGRGVTEVERRRAELTNLFRVREDRCGSLPRLDTGRGIELDQWDDAAVKGRRRRAERLTPAKRARSGNGVVFVAGHQD